MGKGEKLNDTEGQQYCPHTLFQHFNGIFIHEYFLIPSIKSNKEYPAKIPFKSTQGKTLWAV